MFWTKLTVVLQAVFAVTFLQVTKPVPHSVHFHIVPCSPRARGLEWRLFFLSLPAKHPLSRAQNSVLCPSSQAAQKAVLY